LSPQQISKLEAHASKLSKKKSLSWERFERFQQAKATAIRTQSKENQAIFDRNEQADTFGSKQSV